MVIEVIGALLFLGGCFALGWVIGAVAFRPKKFTQHADEAIGLTAPPDAAVLNAGHAPLDVYEQALFNDIQRRYHGSFYVPGPEGVSDD